MELLRTEFVTVSLYADEWGKLEAPIEVDGRKIRTIGDQVRSYQSKNFGTIAQPLYVLMDHDESPLVEPVGYTPGVDDYYKFLQSGIRQFNDKHGITSEGH